MYPKIIPLLSKVSFLLAIYAAISRYPLHLVFIDYRSLAYCCTYPLMTTLVIRIGKQSGSEALLSIPADGTGGTGDEDFTIAFSIGTEQLL